MMRGGWLAVCLGWAALTAQGGALALSEPEVMVHEEGGTYVVQADFFVPVPPVRAWQVLTDFDHMAEFIPHLERSRVVQRRGLTWQVDQAGNLELGIFRFRYETQREIVLLPYRRIEGHNLGGSLRLDSQTTLTPHKQGTLIHYEARGVAEVPLPASFGASLMGERVRAQFAAIQAEILRRNGLQGG
ncbi:MAG: SRPBCC family protein [Pseudomonadota bacterium]